MINPQNPSPITLLHPELLWRIFQENIAVVFEPWLSDPEAVQSRDLAPPKPLATVWDCSQVCREWRSMLLQSPSVWGKVIDLAFLGQKKEEYKQEVLSRTGQAPLFIFGRPHVNTLLYFAPFLEENWWRVQSMEIRSIDDIGNRQHISWDFLKKPAHCLENFHLNLMFRDDDVLPDSDRLFNDYAPHLKSFVIQGRNYKLSPKASWLKNLSHVTFCGDHTMEEVFAALEQTPELVTLEMCCSNVALAVAGPAVEGPAIDLPRLRKTCLRLGSHMFNGFSLLERIKLSPDCCMGIATDMDSDKGWTPLSVDEDGYSRYEDAVAKQVLPYLKLHCPTTIYFVPHQQTLFLQEADNVNADPHLINPRYHFCIPLCIDFLDSSLLLQGLANFESFSNVTELSLLLGDYEKYKNATIVSALRAFPSVRTLKTSDKILAHLLENPVAATLFPNLVKLDIHMRGGGVPPDQEPALHSFFRLRKSIGRPISVLELLPTFFCDWPDLDYLEEYSGLLIKWSTILDKKHGEYRCGDGRPEELQFATKEA
ncbi:hypothetical protein CPC08DRAFT_290809 [Agrocybe pediades]|nr:hypothetical protein CPC08DRAFT_290809 [Agrocybe pediades]